MRGRKLMFTAGVVFLSSLACGMLGDGKAALEKQEAFTAQMCACADLDCVQEVQEEYAQWMTDNGMDFAAAAADDGDRLTTSVEKMSQCAEQLAAGAASSGGGGGAEPAKNGADAPPKDAEASDGEDASAGKRGKRGTRGKGKGKRKR